MQPAAGCVRFFSVGLLLPPDPVRQPQILRPFFARGRRHRAKSRAKSSLPRRITAPTSSLSRQISRYRATSHPLRQPHLLRPQIQLFPFQNPSHAAMSRRSKREFAPPPPAVPCSSPPTPPIPQSTPPPSSSWFPMAPPGWFAAAQQGVPGPFWPPMARPTADLGSDEQDWGLDSRPPGGFLSYFSNAVSSAQHVNKASLSQPTNVDNGETEGDDHRSEKRLSWTTDEDERLVHAWLGNSNDPIESNFKKNEQYWKDVAAVYNSTTPKNRARSVKQVKDRFQKIKKNVSRFWCCWKEANRLWASGESADDVKEKAKKMYVEDYKDGPFKLMHCWTVLSEQPKWSAYLDRLESSNKRKLDDDCMDVNELAEDDPRPIGEKKAKALRKGKVKGENIIEIEDDLRKFYDVQKAANDGRSELLETQRRVSSENLEAKKLAHLAAKEQKEAAKEQKEAALHETYRALIMKDTREMADDERAEHVLALKCMREKLFS